MDRKSGPFRAEIECDIVGRHAGDINYKGLVKAGEKVLVETGEGGALVAKHLGGSMLGWLPREVAGVLRPLLVCGVVKSVAAIAQDDLVYACRDKPPRRLTLSCTSENDGFVDALSPLRGLQPAAQRTDPVVVTTPSRPGAAEAADPEAGTPDAPAASTGPALSHPDTDAIFDGPGCDPTESVKAGSELGDRGRAELQDLRSGDTRHSELGEKSAATQQHRSRKKGGRPKGVKKDVGVKSKKLERDQLLLIKVEVDKGIGYKKIYSKYKGNWHGVGLSAIKAAAARIKARGSVDRKKGSGRPNSAVNEENVGKVKALLESEGGKETSLKEFSAALGLSKTACQGILTKQLKKKSVCKIKTQHIRKTNQNSRLQICTQWKAEMDADYKMDPRAFFWTDEKVFRLFKVQGGNQNYRVWIDEALPKADVPTDDIIRGDGEQQGGVSIMVALGASWKGGLGRPRFVTGSARINSEKYVEICRDTFLVDIAAHFGGDEYVYQQDGATAHTSKATKKFCDQNFRAFLAKQEWPSTSPDLNPLDYFIWGHLQREVDKLKPKTETALRLSIIRAVDDTPLDLVRRGIDGFYKRVCLCIEAQGKAFKHMLKRKHLPQAPSREVAEIVNIPVVNSTEGDVAEDDPAMDVDHEGDI